MPEIGSDIDGLARREELDERRGSIRKRRRIIWLSIIGVLVLFILFLVLYHFTNVMFGVSKELDSEPKSGDWAMFHRDQSHTGSTGTDVSPNGTLKWTFTAGGGIHSSPAVVNGVVYFGSRDHYIYALNAETGQQIWSFKTDSWVESSPAVVDGVLYCGSNDGHLYAIDAATGAELWRFRAPYAIRSSPAVANNRVYVGSDDYHFYAVDALTGKELWKLETDNLVISSPVVIEGIVVVGSVDGSCYALNAENGRHRLEFKVGASIVSSPAEADGVVYLTNTAGLLYAVDARARNWLFENRLYIYWKALYLYGVAPKPPVPSGYIWAYMLGFGNRVGSSPAVLDGVIYVGSDKSMISMNAADQKINWKFPASDWILSSPAVTSTAIYFGSNDGRIYALDRTTGVKLWDYLTGDKVTSSPAVVDGRVFVGSEDGRLYAFD